MKIKRELIPSIENRIFSYKIDIDLWPVWHNHPEIDILLFLKNTGHHITGDFIGTIQPGSLFFNSPYIPHAFTANEPDEGDPSNPATIVIQFSEETLGEEFLSKSEVTLIKEFIQSTQLSCEFFGKTRRQVAQIMEDMTNQRGVESLMSFLHILFLLATAPDDEKRSLVSPNYTPVLNERNVNRIETVRKWIMDNLTDSITLEQAAKQVNLSPKSFSYFFKKNTGRTFAQYIKELRIGIACRLLSTTDRSILDVCYASGFNNLSNFNRRFKEVREMTPKEYRKLFSSIG
ncbi:MAG: AraC family transcriptional regulator [Verrucomicrobiota bacterium]